MFKYSYIVIFLLLVSCGVKQPDIYQPSEDIFIKNSVKMWKSIDITSDVLYTILGDMYKQNILNDSHRDKLINIGNVVKQNQELAREAIISYLWASQVSENSSENIQREKVINTLILTAKSFYKMKDDIAKVYSEATGKNIEIPDIFLFDAITESLLQGD